VKYVPELWVNLFSIPIALKKGFQIGNIGQQIYVENTHFRLLFDKVIETGRSFVCGTDLFPIVDQAAVALSDPSKKIHINQLHDILGHPSEDYLRTTSKYYGWKTFGSLESCQPCGVSKARQAALNKEHVPRSTIPGERIFIDTSSISTESFGGNKFWILALDDCTDCGFSFFVNAKSKLPEVILTFLKDLRDRLKIKVKYIRCDDAPEHMVLERLCKQEGNLGITFEYTSAGTPQRNGRVERKFATLFGRVRAMLNYAGLPMVVRAKIWAEAANTAQKMDNIMVGSNKPESPYRAFHKKDPPYMTNMKTFGQMAILANHENKKI
jgi:hypothetical protein